VMQAAYAGKDLTGKEIDALVAFLQHVDKEHARQMPKEWGWRMFSAGAGGVVVLLGIFSLAGRRRKTRCVNQDIYDRQVKSERRANRDQPKPPICQARGRCIGGVVGPDVASSRRRRAVINRSRSRTIWNDRRHRVQAP
jgi:hypothetical protein